MKDGIDIEIKSNDSTIADIHKTVSSIINQLNLSHSKHNIFFSNLNNNNDITTEIDRLSKASLTISSTLKDYRYHLTINAGDVISRAYIYKAIHYLKNNPVAFVCPEYSFCKIARDSIIATTINDNRLPNHIHSIIIDKAKVNSNQTFPLTSTIIRNTCTLVKSYQNDFYHYYKALLNHRVSLDSALFRPARITHQYNTFNDTDTKQKAFTSLRKTVRQLSGKSKLIKKLFHQTYNFNNSKDEYRIVIPYISPEINHELAALSCLNYDYKGFRSMRFFDMKSSTDQQTETLFKNYKQVSTFLSQNKYDYIMLLPWIISGGADLFAINYLNAIAKLRPEQKILAILTNGTRPSIPKNELNLEPNIEILNLPTILKDYDDEDDDSLLLLYSIINILSPSKIHIIASKLGYNCIIKYGNILRQRGIRLIFTSYNYLVDEHGDYVGYTVQELPRAYHPHDIVTTDNYQSRQLWITEYGFLPTDIFVHNQSFDVDKIPNITPTNKDGINILWAAHIRPEKNPEILLPIAEKLKKSNIQIDCYGLFDANNWENGKNPLKTGISNLHYCGAYRDFFKDIDLSKYDLFLYTSFSDGTPNVILEAGLAGLPIVSSAIGGIPDVVGNNAHLVSNPNSVQAFISAIEDSLTNHETSIKKAHLLQKTLIQKYSKTNFNNQVAEMLERSDS